MEPSKASGAILTTFLAFFLHSLSQINAWPSPNDHSPSDFVKSICNHTVDPSFCLKTFQSDPRTAAASDIKKLSKIALELAVADTKSTRSLINGMVSDKKTKPEFRQPLKECADSYELAVLSFLSAYRELEEDAMTANYDSLMAGDQAGDCRNAMEKAGVRIESVSARISITKAFSSIADTVTSMLEDAEEPGHLASPPLVG